MPADQCSSIEFLKDRLKYSSDEGSDMIFDGRAGFKPSYETISLFFDVDFRPIITKGSWLLELQSGKKNRILAARIDKPEIIAFRAHDLPKMRQLEDVQNDVDLDEICQYVEGFMKARTDNGPPYYRVIGNPPHWGYGREHAFDIFTEDAGDDREFASKIEKYWQYDASTRLSDRVLSLHFHNNIGFYISKQDEQLIASWAGLIAGDDKEQIISRYDMRMKDSAKRFKRLVYARLAEKAAVSIYSSLSSKVVEDCSILQIEGGDKRWQDFDILANRPIDVKNATVYRRNSRQNFIPKFKRSGDHDVVIAAFATARGTFGGLEQTFLGEVSKPDIDLSRSAVQRAFPGLEAIQVRFDDQYLPAWSFEYPFGKINYVELLNAYELLAERPESIVAAALAAGKVREIGAYARLKSSQRRIIDLFSEAVLDSSYSKKTIVLFAVSGFMSEILSGGNAFGFIRFFRKLFQMEELGERDKRRVGAKMCPPFPESNTGGLADPLRSVSNMFDLLERSAKEISASDLEFSAFHAPNPYVLLGRLKSGRKITVYAYCGGRSEAGILCDTFPLVVGNNNTCRKCGKLICHKCGFCSSGCTTTSQ